MPAYSFKERFVPMVLDGSKPHTIRKRRAKGFAKVGDTLYLYFGMRTKWCRKLREETCTDVRTIMITYSISGQHIWVFLYNRRLTDQELGMSVPKLKQNGVDTGMLIGGRAEQFAWRDGFRPEGSTLEQPGNALELMQRFWQSTHELPFIGDVIYWQPTAAGLAKAATVK